MDDFKVVRAGFVGLGGESSRALDRIEARLAEAEAQSRESSQMFLDSDRHLGEVTAERDEARADAERLAEALRAVAGCTTVVKDGPDGQPAIYVRRPEPALDFAVETARAALAAHEGLGGNLKEGG